MAVVHTCVQLPSTRTLEVMSANEVQLHSSPVAVIIISAIPKIFDFTQRFDVQIGPTFCVRYQHAQHGALCVCGRVHASVCVLLLMLACVHKPKYP